MLNHKYYMVQRGNKTTGEDDGDDNKNDNGRCKIDKQALISNQIKEKL